MKCRLLTLALLWLAALAQPALATDTVYYYYTDALHSTVVQADAQGNIVEQPTHYAPYGQVLNRSMRDGPGYTGHEEDPSTGLNYMQQRYFDSQSGRFLSTDPVLPTDDGGNFNRYWYANDNPYRYTDPDGQCPECIGALVGGGLEFVVQMLNPEDRAAYGAAVHAFAHGDFRGGFRDAGPQLAKVGISAAAGALGAGIAGKVGELAGAVSQATTTTAVGKVTVGALVQVGGNSVAGAGVNAAAKVGENAVSGNPLGQGVGTAAKVGAISGAVGGGLEAGATPGAQRLANDTGVFIGTANGRVAAPGVESAAAQRLGAASTESINHAAQCVKTDKNGGGC